MRTPVPSNLTTMLFNAFGNGLGSQLAEVSKQHAETIRRCQESLTSPEMAPFIAGLLKSLGCKEDSALVLDPDGTLIVEGRLVKPLESLRKEAHELGVDISKFGRKVTAIRAFLDEVREEKGKVTIDEVLHHEPKTPPKGFVKVGPAVRATIHPSQG